MMDQELAAHVEQLINPDAGAHPIPDGLSAQQVIPYKIEAAIKVVSGSTSNVGYAMIMPNYADFYSMFASTTASTSTTIADSLTDSQIYSVNASVPFVSTQFGAGSGLATANIGVRARAAGTYHILAANESIQSSRGGEAWIIHGTVVTGVGETDLPRLEQLGLATRLNIDGSLNKVTVPAHHIDCEQWSTNGLLVSDVAFPTAGTGSVTPTQSTAGTLALLVLAPAGVQQTWKLWVKYNVEYEAPAKMLTGSNPATGAARTAALPHPLARTARILATRVARSQPPEMSRQNLGSMRSFFSNAFGWVGRKTKNLANGLGHSVTELAKGHISKELKGLAPELLALL